MRSTSSWMRCVSRFDVADEACAVLGRHAVLVQQLGRAADSRQRALQLVRQRLHVVGHVVAAGQRVAHLVVGGAERAQCTPAQARQAERALRAHVAHVVGREPERAHHPQQQDQHQHQHRGHRGRADQQCLAARRGDELVQALHRLADADDGDDLAAAAHRRRDVHHRAQFVARDARRGARAVVAAQRGGDVAPARPVLALALAERIEQHAPAAVHHQRLQFDAGLLEVEDARREAARVGLAEHRPQHLGVDRAVAGVLLDQRGQQVRRLDQRLLGRFAVARVDVGQQPVHQQADADGVGQQDRKKETAATRHRLAGRSSASA